MVATGRRLGLPTGHGAELAAIAFLCHPGGLVVLEKGFTEPFLALSATLCAWTLAGGGGARGPGFALAGVLSTKQYGFLWLVPLWMSGRLHWRHAVLAGILTAGLNIPFLLWNPGAFWRGVF